MKKDNKKIEFSVAVNIDDVLKKGDQHENKLKIEGKTKDILNKRKRETQLCKISHIGLKLVVKEQTYNYGNYLEITDIPFHIMSMLIMYFWLFWFNKDYDTYSATIGAGKDDAKHDKKVHIRC